MKNQNNQLLTFVFIGAGLFAASKFGLFGGGTNKGNQDDDSSESPEAKSVDAVIDTEAEKMSIPQALDTARDIVRTAQDAAVLIKTPDGQPNIAVSTGTRRGIFSRLSKRNKGLKKAGVKIDKARLRELKKKARQFCKSKPKKQRSKCRKDYLKINQSGLDKLVI